MINISNKSWWKHWLPVDDTLDTLAPLTEDRTKLDSITGIIGYSQIQKIGYLNHTHSYIIQLLVTHL